MTDNDYERVNVVMDLYEVPELKYHGQMVLRDENGRLFYAPAGQYHYEPINLTVMAPDNPRRIEKLSTHGDYLYVEGKAYHSKTGIRTPEHDYPGAA